MTSDVHPSEPDPGTELVAVTESVAAGWLRRVTVDAARRGGVDLDGDDELDRVVSVAARRLVHQLTELVATDVDAQRTNPLSLFRASVAGPTALLRARGVPSPAPSPLDAAMFPDDEYRLGPATWSDVHADLHDPGLAWGAWKALTVLRRRRDEGLR